MSLLLEALKKAEKAKEDAQRKAGGEAPPPAATPPARPELTLQPDAPRHVTRSELPDIHQPLEILSDDIAPAARAAPPEARPAASSSAARKPAARPEPAEASRAGARKVFEAKFKEPNPRLPFYITLGVLGIAAVGIVVYFWYQLRPPPMLVSTSPPAASAPAASVPVPVAPPAPSAAQASTSPIAGLPGVPATASPPAAPAAAAPATPARGPRPAAIPSDPPPSAARPRPPAGASSAEPAQQMAISRPVPQIHPQVQSAYAAFTSGDVNGARVAYEAALRDEPANRDALLGLAAIDVRAGRLDAAEATYVRLLRADPRDAHAQAGLLGLRASRVDPLAAESRVKNLLAADPGAHVLHFTLGNQLAQQGRWSEAQQHYFKAFSAEPDHPDFAFNLAVSLDNLRQHRLARQYYDRAIALAEKRGASFDLGAARERSRQLAD
jgi:Flp pilus assembly protein TadD